MLAAQGALADLPFAKINSGLAVEGAVAEDSPRFADLASAYFYLPSTDRNSPFSEAALIDKAWHVEMRRRADIVGKRSQQQIFRWLQKAAY